MSTVAGSPSIPEVRASARVAEQEAWNADAGFYLTMALVSAAIILVGFAPSFYLKSLLHAPPPLTTLTVVHGVVFTGWVLLFITQTALIALKRAGLHRQLGILGAILFGAMVTVGLSTALTAGRLGHAPPESPVPLAFMALPLFLIAGALALVALGLWNRRRPDWHKRLMLASLVMLTGPGTGRIAIPLGFARQQITIGFVVTELLLVIAIWHDYRVHKAVHRAYWIAAGIFVAVHIGVTWAFGSAIWMAFARAIT